MVRPQSHSVQPRQTERIFHHTHKKCLLEDDTVYVALTRIFGDTGFVVVFNSKDGEVVINHVDQRTDFTTESKGTRQTINPDYNGANISLRSSNGQEVFLNITTKTYEPITVFSLQRDGDALQSDHLEHRLNHHQSRPSYRKYLRLFLYFVVSWLVYFIFRYIFM